MASLMHNLNDKKFFSTMNQEREFDIFDTFDAYCISIIRKCALIIVYYWIHGMYNHMALRPCRMMLVMLLGKGKVR